MLLGSLLPLVAAPAQPPLLVLLHFPYLLIGVTRVWSLDFSIYTYFLDDPV